MRYTILVHIASMACEGRVYVLPSFPGASARNDHTALVLTERLSGALRPHALAGTLLSAPPPTLSSNIHITKC